jgi:hypothetical protein
MNAIRFYVVLVLAVAAVFAAGFLVGKATTKAPIHGETVMVQSVESEENEDGHKVTVVLKDN